MTLKKSNGILILLLFLVLLVTTTVSEFRKQLHEPAVEAPAQTDVPTLPETMPMETAEPAAPASMENTLFIGDSRTVGLSEYAKLDEADFFSNVGMSVYNVGEARVSIPEVGKVSLEELLEGSSYDRIYLMLGINELGYPFRQTVARYDELVASIRSAQPQALIFLQANLHVTKARSDTDEIINNPAIDRFNQEVSKLADEKTVFYLDANCIFDDPAGNLDEEKSDDDTHPLARCYPAWGNWLAEQTGEVLAYLQGAIA